MGLLPCTKIRSDFRNGRSPFLHGLLVISFLEAGMGQEGTGHQDQVQVRGCTLLPARRVSAPSQMVSRFPGEGGLSYI